MRVRKAVERLRLASPAVIHRKRELSPRRYETGLEKGKWRRIWNVIRVCVSELLARGQSLDPRLRPNRDTDGCDSLVALDNSSNARRVTSPYRDILKGNDGRACTLSLGYSMRFPSLVSASNRLATPERERKHVDVGRV